MPGWQYRFILASTLNFPRTHRLIGKHAFRHVFTNSKRITHSSLLAFYQGREREHQPRLGIIIKKQIVKKAVERNKIRRLIRESFRQIQNAKALRGLDIVILVRSECTSNHKILRTNIDHIWNLIAHAHQSRSSNIP